MEDIQNLTDKEIDDKMLEIETNFKKLRKVTQKVAEEMDLLVSKYTQLQEEKDKRQLTK